MLLEAPGEGRGCADSACVRICDPKQVVRSHEEMRGPPHLCLCKSMAPDTIDCPHLHPGICIIVFYSKLRPFYLENTVAVPFIHGFIFQGFNYQVNHSLQILNGKSQE